MDPTESLTNDPPDKKNNSYILASDKHHDASVHKSFVSQAAAPGA